MKKWLIMCFILLTVLPLCLAVKIAELEEIQKFPTLVIGDQYLYIWDRSTLNIHIYSRKDFSFLGMFGKKGEGPGEFKWINVLQIFPDFLFISGMDKISFFSKMGKLKDEKRANPNSGKYSLLGKNFICTKFVPQKPTAKYAEIKFTLLDSDLQKNKDLFKTKILATLHYNPLKKKQDFMLVSGFAGYKVYNDRLYIGTTERGIYFAVFDSRGKKLYAIDHPYKRRELTAEHKSRYIGRVLRWHGPKVKRMYNLVLPEYFPAFSNFDISDGKIYVLMFPEHPDLGKPQEILVLDLDGKLLKKTTIPYREAFCISKGKYYYLIDNEITEMWELHADPIK